MRERVLTEEEHTHIHTHAEIGAPKRKKKHSWEETKIQCTFVRKGKRGESE